MTKASRGLEKLSKLSESVTEINDLSFLLTTVSSGKWDTLLYKFKGRQGSQAIQLDYSSRDKLVSLRCGYTLLDNVLNGQETVEEFSIDKSGNVTFRYKTEKIDLKTEILMSTFYKDAPEEVKKFFLSDTKKIYDIVSAFPFMMK